MAGLGLAADRRVEAVSRASYGRLLALLASWTGDIAAAEDGLAEAFAQAVRCWPADGPPAVPEAWLLTVARNRLRNDARARGRRATAPVGLAGETAPEADDPLAIPDRRLALMFVCAHPAIEPGIRTPLMLQTVLGLEVARIAEAFAVPAPAMAQRLVRAKRRIRDARIAFVIPDRREMPRRLPPVLEAIYGAYAIDWLSISGPVERECLAGEALYLAGLLAGLLATEPEALGLAALIAFSVSRAPARLSSDGRLVPLAEQDSSRWNTDLIAQAESLLHRAHRLNRPGRFQIEAAIESAHCARARTGSVDRQALLKLHQALTRLAPSLGAQVALAAALGETHGPEAGLAHLDGIDGSLSRFQPAWATRAHLLARAGRLAEAAEAYARAVSLTSDMPVRRHLERQAAALSAAPQPGAPRAPA